jgi:hypothetical protein
MSDIGRLTMKLGMATSIILKKGELKSLLLPN